MRGYGLSEKPLDGTYLSNYTLNLQADIYEAVTAEEGLTSVVLVAHDMGQSVGLELMNRQEEGRLSFDIRHAIILDGSTLIDQIELVPMQKKLLAQPDVAATEDLGFEDFESVFTGTYGTKFLDSGDHDTARIAQTHQVFYDHGSRIMAQTLRYLKERKENFDESSRILFTYGSAPMTVIWGVEDPVAVIAMADRIKRNRPVTDLYKMEGTSHWPMIEDPEYIGDAIIARLDSV